MTNKCDPKIFEYLRRLEEWKEIGEQAKEVFAEMPREDIENMTQEDMDKLVCEDFWDLAIAFTSKLIYEKLQRDLDIYYGKGPVGELKQVLTKHQIH